jgi:hypothetical protein
MLYLVTTKKLHVIFSPFEITSHYSFSIEIFVMHLGIYMCRDT